MSYNVMVQTLALLLLEAACCCSRRVPLPKLTVVVGDYTRFAVVLVLSLFF